MTDHRIRNAERTLMDVQGFLRDDGGFVSPSGDVRARIGEGYETVDLVGRPIPEEEQVRHIHYRRIT